jgi:DNA polymerase-1
MNKLFDKTILIIDIYGLLFRSYFAIKERLHNGININAIFGTLHSMINILENVHHDHIIIAADSGGKNFRHELYNDYKANRASCPEDLVPQFQILDEMINAMQISLIRMQGFEADDIIASICQNVNAKCVIATHDKDLYQLVSERVCIYNSKDKSFVHQDDVVKKFGIKADFISDFLALTGDSSDNIPGVKNIGPKTAINLINEFGSINNILTNIDKLTEKTRILIENDIDNLNLSRALASLKYDIDLIEEVSKSGKFEMKNDKFLSFIQKYSLESVISRFNLDYKKTNNNQGEAQMSLL